MTASRWPKPGWAALWIACFVYFSRHAVRVKFAPDDLMNMEHYWRLSGSKVLLQLVAPWTGGYRPMGAAFYLPLLRTFGLDPAPYHVAMLAILLANVFLVYRFARALGCAETPSGVAALLVCYHPGLSFLYFNTSFIYDALCAFFYLAALGYYVSVRGSGRRLGATQLAVFLALHYGGLLSKEMAMTLPAVVLAYEWVCQKHRQISGAMLAGALNLPFLYGLFGGRDPLAGLSIYRPELSAARVFAFHRDAFADLFVSWHTFNIAWVLGIWIAFTIVAWWPKRPFLRFCWLFFVITPLPLELLEGRTNACLAIPVCGLAIFAAVLVTESASAVADLVRQPRIRRAVFAAIVTAALAPWAVHSAILERRLIRPQMRELGEETWAVIRQLRDLKPTVRQNSVIVFLNDPFDGFDMAFIAELWFRQPGLNIRLDRKTPFSPEELAKADHVFSFEKGQLTQIR